MPSRCPCTDAKKINLSILDVRDGVAAAALAFGVYGQYYSESGEGTARGGDLKPNAKRQIGSDSRTVQS